MRMLAGRLTGMILLVVFCLDGCATWQAPEVVDDSALRARAVFDSDRDVTLSASVLSAADSQALFGTDLVSSGVQPVWIEVSNQSSHTLWLLRSGTDPSYFSPLEVAWPLHKKFAKASNDRIDAYFDALAFENPVPPGTTRSGILFTNPHLKTRVLNVDLLGQQTLFPFTLFLPVPGEYDAEAESALQRLKASSHTDYQDSEEFRAALEQLPCCATGGEPINVVFVGAISDIGAALIRREYRLRRLPGDDRQTLFGRPPDLVARRAGRSGVPAGWLRMWVAPLQFQGKAVMVVQSGRPAEGRFAEGDASRQTLYPDVDESRNLLIQDLLYSGGLAQLGFVRGSAPIAETEAASDGSELRFHTDGLRAVLFFVTRPLALSDVELLDWVPALQQRIDEAANSNPDRQDQ